MTQKRPIRLTLQIPPEAHQRLVHLRDSTDSVSFVEVIKRALWAYDHLLEHRDEKQTVTVLGTDGVRTKLAI